MTSTKIERGKEKGEEMNTTKQTTIEKSKRRIELN